MQKWHVTTRCSALHGMGLHGVVRYMAWDFTLQCVTWHGTTLCSALHGMGLHGVVR